MNVSIAVVAWVLLIAVAAAIRSTKSALFMHIPPDTETCGAITRPGARYVKRTRCKIKEPSAGLGNSGASIAREAGLATISTAAGKAP